MARSFQPLHAFLLSFVNDRSQRGTLRANIARTLRANIARRHVMLGGCLES